MRASANLGTRSAAFASGHDHHMLTGGFEREHCVLDGLLSGFQFVHGHTLGWRHGTWLHYSDADQAELVQMLERRRGVDARAFDGYHADVLQAHDRGIDLGPRAVSKGVVHTLSLTAAKPPNDL